MVTRNIYNFKVESREGRRELGLEVDKYPENENNKRQYPINDLYPRRYTKLFGIKSSVPLDLGVDRDRNQLEH